MDKAERSLILVSRWLILLVIGAFALLHTPNLATFPYLDKITLNHLPPWIYSWANFDGVHYVGIAYQGYHEFDQAFFPLYPFVIWLVNFIVRDYVIAGLLISNVSYILLGHIFYRYIKALASSKVAKWATLMLLMYPTAFFLNGVYSESLFLLFTVSCLYSMHTKNYHWASIFGFLAALTRLQGILMVIPILCSFIVSKDRRTLPILLGPFVGLGTYILYLWRSVGDPLYFLTAQSAFGAERSSNLILFPQVIYRYIKIFLTADMSYAYMIAALEFSFFIGVFCILTYLAYNAYKRKKVFELGLVLFSFAHLLLPTFTGSFSSIPRYSLCALALFIGYGHIRSHKVKVGILCISAVLQVILVALFVQGRFVS